MKKHLIPLFIGCALFLIGIACFYIETINYQVSSSLTSNFELEQKVLEYEINDNETVRITNDGTNKNINLYISNSLTDEVKIVIEYADILNINSKYDTKSYSNEKIINIDLESDLILNFDSINDLSDLGVMSLKNKTIYNYTLLKYPEIKVFVNEKYKNNIEFVNSYGKTYNPIG